MKRISGEIACSVLSFECNGLDEIPGLLPKTLPSLEKRDGNSFRSDARRVSRRFSLYLPMKVGKNNRQKMPNKFDSDIRI